MGTKYKNTSFHFLAAVGFVMLLAPYAHAVTNTPLDCPEVIAVQGGYRLIQDTTCGFQWHEDNKFFNLNGFTLTGGPGLVEGIGLTIRNGALQTNGIYWGSSNKGTLSNLEVTSAGNPRGFFIEAGSNFTVKNSTFTNIPGIALDFFFGSGGTVKNSKFIGNGRAAISIQRSSDVLIEHNKFIGNIRGVNLFDEDGGGVNNNRIRYNIFRGNEVGINVSALPPFTVFPAIERNQIIGNMISRSSHSGVLINVTCLGGNPALPPVCPAQGTKVGGNRLSRNGFGVLTDLPDGAEPDDDGVTARATLWGSFNENIPYPDGLAGVTLSNNRAYLNADLGFDVEGVTDGGGQVAGLNGNLEQCVGLACRIRGGELFTAWQDSIPARPLAVLQDAISDAPSAFDQLRHK